MVQDDRWEWLIDVRVAEPERIAAAHAARRRRTALTVDGALFIVAADHPARGVLGVGGDRRAMADRRTLIERLLVALVNPRVDGVLASCDILDDLALLGALDDKVAIGTMNRGGLAGAVWELDDGFTSYDTEHLAASHLDGGKMLLRIDPGDAGTAATLAGSARAVQQLNDAGLMAMVEPLPYTKNAAGAAVWSDDPEAMLSAVAVGAALGGSSARTWLKIPAGADIGTVAAVTTQPLLLLGGAPGPDPEQMFATWQAALAQPTVRGLVVGRALLYPPDGDVAGAIGRAADLVHAAARHRHEHRTPVEAGR